MTETPILKPEAHFRCAAMLKALRSSLLHCWGAAASQIAILIIGLAAASTADATSEGRWQYAPYGRPIADGSEGFKRDTRLCQALLKHLNNIEWAAQDAIDYYAFGDVVTTFPGFTEPPWESIDPKEHREFLGELLRYWQIGHSRYFGLIPGPRPDWPIESFLSQLDGLVSSGWTFEKWTAPLLNNYEVLKSGGPVLKVSGPSRTVVQMRLVSRGRDPNDSSGRPRRGYHTLPYSGYEAHIVGFVKQDLSGPDPSLPNEANGVATRGHFLLYEGHPYVVTNEAWLWTPDRTFTLGKACRLKFQPTRSRRK